MRPRGRTTSFSRDSWVRVRPKTPRVWKYGFFAGTGVDERSTSRSLLWSVEGRRGEARAALSFVGTSRMYAVSGKVKKASRRTKPINGVATW